ncbi:hypothetical protein [Pseudolabrys sp. FHR47]|uniref:hypothetical protein n=1 Tax=Pseudolabrys sp. FHR47 TaxID=2562284 RepID=UPI0010BEDFD2|nr:hypothetical protein [Pseudolabrys sp. FHR47]
MAKKAKRKSAPKTVAKSKARNKSKARKKSASKKTSKKKVGAKKTKAIVRRKRGVTTFAATATLALTLSVDQKLRICEQTRACIAKLVNDPTILYNTNLRTRFNWDDNNFIQLADDLPPCFLSAGMKIPKALSRPALKKCAKVQDVCYVVVAAYE